MSIDASFVGPGMAGAAFGAAATLAGTAYRDDGPPLSATGLESSQIRPGWVG